MGRHDFFPTGLEGLDLVLVVVGVADREFRLVEQETEAAEPEVGAELPPVHRDVHRQFFLVADRPVVVPHVAAVEVSGERNPVAGVIEAHGAREPGPLAEETKPRLSLIHGAFGVLDHPGRGVVVLGPVRVAPAPGEPVPAGRLRANAAPHSLVGGRVVEVGLPPESGRRRVREVGRHGDHVHGAADGVRPVEQRRRPPHDLDPFGLQRVHRNPVVRGLAAQIAGPHAVLHDEHPVPVEAAHDRARGAGSETAHRHAGGALQQLREVARRLVLKVEPLQRVHRTEGLERRRIAGRGGDRDPFVHPVPRPEDDGFADLEVLLLFDVDRHGPDGAEEAEVHVEGDGTDVVHVHEREAAVVVGMDHLVGLDQQDFGVVRRFAGFGDDHRARDRRMRPGGGREGEADGERTGPPEAAKKGRETWKERSPLHGGTSWGLWGAEEPDVQRPPTGPNGSRPGVPTVRRAARGGPPGSAVARRGGTSLGSPSPGERGVALLGEPAARVRR